MNWRSAGRHSMKQFYWTRWLSAEGARLTTGAEANVVPRCLSCSRYQQLPALQSCQVRRTKPFLSSELLRGHPTAKATRGHCGFIKISGPCTERKRTSLMCNLMCVGSWGGAGSQANWRKGLVKPNSSSAAKHIRYKRLEQSVRHQLHLSGLALLLELLATVDRH